MRSGDRPPPAVGGAGNPEGPGGGGRHGPLREDPREAAQGAGEASGGGGAGVGSGPRRGLCEAPGASPRLAAPGPGLRGSVAGLERAGCPGLSPRRRVRSLCPPSPGGLGLPRASLLPLCWRAAGSRGARPNAQPCCTPEVRGELLGAAGAVAEGSMRPAWLKIIHS